MKRQPPHPRLNDVVDGTIICTKCEMWQALDQFNLAKRSKRGRVSWCKSCMSIYHRDVTESRTSEERARRAAEGYERNRRQHTSFNGVTGLA